MINREISYERDVNRSYMKIPALPEESFDETIMLRKPITGMIPMEKCYVNGAGQYWYNISGKQALDAYCRVNTIGKDFFEKLVLRFCEQTELLEWNLIDINCLVMDPELVFVNNNGEEISFVAYPFHKGDLFMELQQLMEYILTRLNHSDADAVKAAYKIYDLTLSESFSIVELKKYILETRMEQTVIDSANTYMTMQSDISEKTEDTNVPQVAEKPLGWDARIAEYIDHKLTILYEKAGKILEKTPLELYKARQNKKSQSPVVVYPDEEKPEQKQVLHPTICISEDVHECKGELISDFVDRYPSFHVEGTVAIIGKSPTVQFQIQKDTISQFHARMEYQEGSYYIEDLNSTNGTYINDSPLSYKQRYCLEAGDNIRFADVSYHFY